ncbi:MAG TPA: septum site-determining protein Ssd [Nocardioides sp.]|jgi:secretion/DNA translocation related CpaE-like protein|nr:septum site-determining protein Ssd [Nocardioides sp.]
MTAPLFVTSDESLLEELLRLAAAAGTTPEVAHDVPAALRAWLGAPLILVGADLADDLARAAPSRRPAVFVVLTGTVPDRIFQTALSVGAESVAELPRSEGWLVERLTDVVDTGPARGLTLGVIGGSGGAGATTFACALAQMAARQGPSVVLDLDPLGPGVDRVLGLDLTEGVRWDALGHTTGRLSARALRDSVPRRDGCAALTWFAGPRPRPLQAFAVREALSAARRGHDTVVVDLPRGPDPLVDEVAARCDRVLIVVAASVTGVAAAVRTCGRFADSGALGLVVRGSGIDDETVGRLVGAPVVATVPDQRGVAEAVDLGLGPVRTRRNPLGRAALATLTAVGEQVRARAA